MNASRSLRPYLGIVLVMMLGCACTAQQGYGAAQAWQRTECQRLPDAEQRARCLASTQTSYEDYQREAEATRNRQTPR